MVAGASLEPIWTGNDGIIILQDHPPRIITNRGATVYDVTVDDQLSSAQVPGRLVWLSGAILTLLNKVVFPALWLAFVAGVPIWVFVTYGRISISGGFGFIFVFVLVSTVVMRSEEQTAELPSL